MIVSALPNAAFGTCGDGVLESPAEECDDGNVSTGDCCAADCQYEPAGTECGADDICLAGHAACLSDGRCEPYSPCNGNTTADLYDPGPPEREKLKMRGRGRASTPFDVADLGDPSTGTQYAICIYVPGASSYEVAYRLMLPPGPAWQAIAGGFTYRRPDGDTSPLRSARVRGRRLTSYDNPTFAIWAFRYRFSADGAELALPGPVDSTQYFDLPEPETQFDPERLGSFCLVNELGFREGVEAVFYEGQDNRGFINEPEHVHWVTAQLGD